MQLWAVYVFRRNCTHGSLVQSDAALRAPENQQESQRQREGRRENPSFLPQPQLARDLSSIAGKMLCPPQHNLSAVFGCACVSAALVPSPWWKEAPVPSPWWKEGSCA